MINSNSIAIKKSLSENRGEIDSINYINCINSNIMTALQ